MASAKNHAPVIERNAVETPAEETAAAVAADEPAAQADPAPPAEAASPAEAAPPAEAPPAAPESATVGAVAAAPATAFAEASKMMEAPLASMGEAQEKVRAMIETGINETRAGYSKVKGVADEAAVALETSFAAAKAGAVEIGVKALEALRETADANFDFAKSLISAKSPSDYVSLHGEFARRQIEMLTAQTKAIAELAQKVVTASIEPIKTQVAKSFKIGS